jgi:hypothetical protein
MNLLSTISLDEAKALSSFSFSKGSRLHLLLPLLFFAIVFSVIFGRMYYQEWKIKRRMRRYWESKSTQAPK